MSHEEEIITYLSCPLKKTSPWYIYKYLKSEIWTLSKMLIEMLEHLYFVNLLSLTLFGINATLFGTVKHTGSLVLVHFVFHSFLFNQTNSNSNPFCVPFVTHKHCVFMQFFSFQRRINSKLWLIKWKTSSGMPKSRSGRLRSWTLETNHQSKIPNKKKPRRNPRESDPNLFLLLSPSH